MDRGDRAAASAADLFDLLWESLADVLGTAAAATLVRRALSQVAARSFEEEPVIATHGLNYEYRLPESWKRRGNAEAVGALRAVAAELRGLLVELTGPVVVRRLGRLSLLRAHGIDFSDEAPT